MEEVIPTLRFHSLQVLMRISTSLLPLGGSHQKSQAVRCAECGVHGLHSPLCSTSHIRHAVLDILRVVPG